MGRSRYQITEPDRPHFLTCTVIEWLPIFTRPEAVAIVLDSWSHLRKHAQFKIYGYVILENHLHLVAQAPNLSRCMASFKSFTARQLVALLTEHHAHPLLDRLHLAKADHKNDRNYQVWQEGSHPQLISNAEIMLQKLGHLD
ncbi:MAG: transposase [Prochlorothrix sp.]